MRDNKKAILVALGGNESSPVGPPALTIHAALDQFAVHGLRVVGVSRLFHSPAWPDPGDPPYVNAVARVETDLGPTAVMAVLHEIETQFGRIRGARNAPRPLDLDLIDYAGLVLTDEAGPILPHPRAHQRAFVLAPLLDLDPGWIHPVLGLSAVTLLAEAEVAGSHAAPAENPA